MAGMFGATPRNDLLKALYFTPPPKNEQYWRGKTLGSISKPQRSTQQTLGNLLANALTPMSGEKRARHVANRAVNALTDLTPVGGAVAAEDARRDWNQGNTLGAILNGGLAALAVIPGMPKGGKFGGELRQMLPRNDTGDGLDTIRSLTDFLSDPRPLHQMYQVGDMLRHKGEIGEVVHATDDAVVLNLPSGQRIVPRRDRDLDVAPYGQW